MAWRVPSLMKPCKTLLPSNPIATILPARPACAMAVAHADGCRFVGTENAYQVRVGSEHVRCLVERSGHVSVGVLRRNDLQLSSSPRCSL